MNAKTFLPWIFAAAVITVVFGTIYVAVQQDIRQGANDPQIEIAQDSAKALSLGLAPDDLLGAAPRTDISNGSSPFIMVFDSTGTLIASTAQNGTNTPPVPPAGVFASVRASGEDRITWQTSSGLRFAAVIDRWSVATSSVGQQTSGFVLAARSISEIEKRESKTATIAFVGWIISILISLAGFSMSNRKAE